MQSMIRTVFLFLLFGVSSAAYGNPFEPSIGEVIGEQIGNAVRAAGQLAASKAEATARISVARSKYFRSYPDKEGVEEAEATLAELLFEKDLYFLSMYLAEGPTRDARLRIEGIETLTGGMLDGGIQPAAWNKFMAWVNAVRLPLGGKQPGQLIFVLDPNKLLKAIESALPEYNRYKDVRDMAEFRAQGIDPGTLASSGRKKDAPPPPDMTVDKNPVSTTSAEAAAPDTSSQQTQASQGSERPGQQVAAAGNTETEVEQQPEPEPVIDFDVLGIRLGMSLEEAQAILRGHMATTSVYRNERPSESNFYPFGAEPFARAVTYLRLQDEPGQGVASDEEIITLMVERSKSGQDEVLGIRRWVSMSKSTNPDAVAALLAKKYGQPASEQKAGKYSSWSWGKVDKRYCKPSIRRLILRKDEPESGEMIPRSKLRKLPIGTVGTTDNSWMKLPEDTRFRSCGPALRAQFVKGKLEILLTDLNRYFARFEELFVSPPKEEAPEPDLAL